MRTPLPRSRSSSTSSSLIVCFLCRSHAADRSEEHTSELQSQSNLVCRLLLEKKKTNLYRVRVSIDPHSGAPLHILDHTVYLPTPLPPPIVRGFLDPCDCDPTHTVQSRLDTPN